MHDHDYRLKKDQEDVVLEGEFSVAYVTRHPACACGEVQPTKRGERRAPHRRVVKAAGAALPRPPRDNESIRIAAALLEADAVSVPWRGRRSKLITRYSDDELLRSMNRLVLAGYVSAEERFSADAWSAITIHILDHAGLQEFVAPGAQARLMRAIQEAKADLPSTPAANRLRAHLDGGAEGWDPETVTWAAALVRHAAQGVKVLRRQFSSRFAGSKEFEKHEGRIEDILGAVGELGIIDSGSLLLAAGPGRLSFVDARLDLSPAWGIVGLERGRLRQLIGVSAKRIMFVENKTVFEAIAMGTVPDCAEVLCFFTQGNVGETMEHVARISQGALQAWMDLDPEGVQMVRSLHAASAGRLQPYRMNPEELDRAILRLPETRRPALEREIARGGILQELLLAIQRTGKWLEQERQLSSRAAQPSKESPLAEEAVN